MSFNDIRLQRKGLLQTKQEERKQVALDFGNALQLIIMKADPYAEPSEIDTPSILKAAHDLNGARQKLKDLDGDIDRLNKELYG